MAPKTPKKVRQSKKKKSMVAKRRVERGVPLDAAGFRYAQLLSDPCNAALVPSTFPGYSGIVQRFTTYYTVGVTAGCTAGILIYNPNSGSISSTDVATGATSATLSYSWNPLCPGYGFLNSNAKDCRALSACMQVMPLASELNRSGYISYGTMDGFALPTGGVITPSQLATNLTNVDRMPDDMIEVKYVPGSGDEFYTPVTSTSPSENTSCLCASWIGIPAASGLVAKLTVVVEWMPQALDGTLSTAHISSGSSNTTNQVKKYLYDVDPHWWVSASKIVGRGARVLADTSLQFLSRRESPRLLTY